MKIKLRAPQVRMLEELMGQQYEIGKNLCVLPAIAWRNILQAMKVDAFGPLGGKRPDRPRAYYTTMSQIQDELMRCEKHPALRSAAVMGVETDIIPAWEVGDVTWSPYPVVDVPFRLLVPRHQEVSGHVVTEWVAEDRIEGSYLWSPSTHWKYVT